MAVIDLMPRTNSLQARIISGSAVLLAGSGMTTAINLSYNIALARFLGPQGFGQATVVYTILTLMSAVTLSFQIVSAKNVAQQSTAEGKAAVYRAFHRGAWACGIVVAGVLLLFQTAISHYLYLPDSSLVAILAIGAAFYVPLGTRRGYIQGIYGFRRLATNLVLEGAVRLGGSLILILAGAGVRGVIAANAAAVAIAYLTAGPTLPARVQNPAQARRGLGEISQAMIFFSGQVLINNCDIVLVKHFFSAKEAGLYAAVAMVGRVIFAFSSAVVNTMFPLVAGTENENRRNLRVIATSLGLVLASGSVLAIGLSIAPSEIWKALFGSGFEIAGRYNLQYLLTLYAVTTIVYSLSVVIITFEMSYKIANTSWVQLAFSAVLIACLCRFHSSLRQVILVQLILMLILLLAVALPFLFNALRKPTPSQWSAAIHPIRLIRRVSEDHVIAEFLKSDFNSRAFRGYQERFREVVNRPDFDRQADNEKRRALLFLRHLALWQEIPDGTEWFEIEINEAGLGQVRVFPRAQWRKLARGNFAVTFVAERMRSAQKRTDTPFFSKIADIGHQLRQDDPGFSSVILIGQKETEELTVLDGNHRLVAAMLAAPPSVGKLRFLCGLSPRMSECCWYKTDIGTLMRYGKNVLVRALRNPEAELERLLQDG